MDEQLTNLSFDEWLNFVFDHPVTSPEWYWKINRDDWNPDKEPKVAVSHITLAFESPTTAFSRFSDAQINQGLWYLVSNSCSNHMFALTNRLVPLAERRQAIAAMYTLFEQIFLPRCSGNLQHLDERVQGDVNPLDIVCYMWWDLLPLIGDGVGPDQKVITEEILEVLRMILDLDSDACRESALHGLGHWHPYKSKQVEVIIDKFLASNRQIRPELASYAESARKGCVL
jgi:hypothetical protein